MSLGVLNNISALYAENNLNQTQTSLQNTLTQLSSGSRINSGADDAAGLAVVNSLQANEAALTQSSQNAANGVGLLQTADGALSQVTNLLNRAVTLATEASNGTLNSNQVGSANQEYQNILTEIGNIGSTTNFNSNKVFTNATSTVFVSDGTSSGANVYNNEVGSLTTASVGQTASAAITTSAIAPVTTAPIAAVANTAGVYKLTAAASSDTLSGNVSFNVGTTGTPTSIAVAPGTTLSALATQLTGNSSFAAAGLTASYTSGNAYITITGPTSGTNAAANAVSFSGTAVVDTSSATTVTATAGTTAVAGAASTATITAGGTAVNGDTLTAGNTVTYQVGNGSTGTFTVAANTTFDNNSTTGISTLLNANAAFHAAGLTASVTGAVLTITGTPGNTSPVTVGGTLVDTTSGHTAGTFTNASSVTTGAAGTAGTYTLTALGSSSDTFDASSVITINSTNVALQGLTGAGAASAINANSTIANAGISAAYNSTTGVLTVTGNATTGASLTVSNTTVKDVPTTTLANSNPTAPAGSAATGASSVITLGSANDTVQGTLAITVGTTGLAKDTLSLNIAANTTGAELANQVNQNASFQTAGVTAAYNTTTNAVTLTGPTGTTNTLSTTGTTLTDSSSATAQAGTDFTAANVGTLTASSAQQILTTVTSAIANVAYQRGILGADVNQLNAASNVASAESENLTSASSSIQSTNYGQATSDMAKYQVLSQTGIAALSQANSVQQEILKLLQ
jgi:flagellin